MMNGAIDLTEHSLDSYLQIEELLDFVKDFVRIVAGSEFNKITGAVQTQTTHRYNGHDCLRQPPLRSPLCELVQEWLSSMHEQR